MSQDENEWSGSEDIDTERRKNSVSQSSISLSKRTLPSISTQGLQQLPLENYNTNNSNSRYSNQSISTTTTNTSNHNNSKSPVPETDDIKQIDNYINNSNIRPHIKRNKSRSSTNGLNIFYDDKTFSKFDKLYKYPKSSNKKTKYVSSISSNCSSFNNTIKVIHIQNYKHLDLCFKETIVSSRNILRRCVDEYKALQKFYNVLYANNGTDINKHSSLYINKKRGSTAYPKRVRLVMKYYEGEDLDDFLVDEDDGEVGFLYEDDFRAIMKKILYQLNICHVQGVLHCDIKPNNIRINEQSEKYEEDHADYYDVNLIDFGFAHICKESKTKKEVKLTFIKGTPGFIAPETIKNKKYSQKSDMFSIGCVAFFLLTNNYAVNQAPDMDLEDMMPNRKRIKHLLKRENSRNRDDSSLIHQKTIDFVLSCLWKSPSKRPTAAQALKLKIFQ